MLNVSIHGDAELIQRLGKLPEDVRQSLLKKVTALTFRLQALVKSKLSGQVLNVRRGTLRNSIFQEVENTSTGVTGKVASSGDVKYAAIHEYGGTIRAMRIYPRTASVLAFQMNGKTVFARYVDRPVIHMPERSYLRSSLKEMKNEIRDGLIEAVKAPMRKP